MSLLLEDESRVRERLLDDQGPVCPVCAPLREHDIGRSEGTVGAELQRAAVYESAVRKNHLVAVTSRYSGDCVHRQKAFFSQGGGGVKREREIR